MSHAVFDCKHCGYTQPVDPVHIGSVFSCPTCSAVVMVTPAQTPGAGNPVTQGQQEARQVVEQTQQAVQQTQQAVQQTQQTMQQTHQAVRQAAYEAQMAAQQQAQQAQQQIQQQAQAAQQRVLQAQQQAQQRVQEQAGHVQQQAAQYVEQQGYQAAQQVYRQGGQAAEQVAAAAAQYADAPAHGTYAVQDVNADPYAQYAANTAQAGYAQAQTLQAAQAHNAAPARQSGFDPAMVAYQTGAVSSPVGVPVASSKVSGRLPDPSPSSTPGFDPLAAEHPLNVPTPDSRRTGSVFANVLLFAVLYILFMTPYLLPYLKLFGVTDLTLLESGAVMSPFTLRLVCSICLVVIALFRGLAIYKAWLFVLPVIAGILDFLPALGLPSFTAPALHTLTLALGVLLSPRRSRRLSF